MLSRDADSCFWIGRYIERAEAAARMTDVHYHFRLELPQMGSTMRWTAILAISGVEPELQSALSEAEEQQILEFFVFDPSNPNGIMNCIRNARENARGIREQVSSEMWETINSTYLQLNQWSVARIMRESPHAFFRWIKDQSHLFQGVMNRTLMMGESRDFLDAGRFLERGAQTARILDVRYHDLLPHPAWQESSAPTQSQTIGPIADPFGVGGTVDVHGWIAVLKSVGAYEAFRKTYNQGVSPARVAAFLLLNAQFPASVLHSIRRVEGCVRRIGENRDGSPANAAERAVGRLSNDLLYVTAEEIIMGGLHEYLEKTIDRCNEIGYAIAETYLRY